MGKKDGEAGKKSLQKTAVREDSEPPKNVERGS